MESTKKEVPKQIQLELPDYSQIYFEWKQKQEKEEKKEETVIIIDIY